MAEYDIRWRIDSAPAAMIDGSSAVRHEFHIVYREAGSGDPWEEVPNQHVEIFVQADALKGVLDMEAGSGKVAAYKALLVQSVNREPAPVIGIATVDVVRQVRANEAAAVEAARANAYILSLDDYPIYFELEI